MASTGQKRSSRERRAPPTSLIRKLHRWELLHLREHTAALEAQLEALTAENERLQRELEYANDVAASWRDDVMRMQEEGMELGLTQDGHVVALAPAAPSAPAADEPEPTPTPAPWRQAGSAGDRIVLAKGSGPGVWNRWFTFCSGRREQRAPVWGRYLAESQGAAA